MSNLVTVGVYGTLKLGRSNHDLLEHVERHAEGWVKGYRLYESGIPFLVKDDTSDYKVKVELYKVDRDTLENLDGLEGHPHAYCRYEVPVEINNEVTTAWIYEYPSIVGRENTTGIF